MSSSMGRMTSLFYYGKWKMFQTTNQIQSNHHFQQPSLHQAILYRFRSSNIRPKFTLKLSFSSLKSQDFPTKNLPTSRHSDHFPEKSRHFAPWKTKRFGFPRHLQGAAEALNFFQEAVDLPKFRWDFRWILGILDVSYGDLFGGYCGNMNIVDFWNGFLDVFRIFNMDLIWIFAGSPRRFQAMINR